MTTRYGRSVLVAAALVPPTGLLVPGVAGRTAVLDEERAAASAAVAAVLALRPERVVVLRDGGGDADLAAGRPGSLVAAGVPDDAWLPAPRNAPTPVTDARATVALWLLAAAGWTGDVLVRDTTARPPHDLVAEVGADATSPTRVGFLLVGGGSVRRGPDAPLADDPRAAEVDARLVAWLTSLDGGDVDTAAAPDDADVRWHGLDAVGPARALAAALAGSGLGTAAVAASVPLGATYLAATWLPGATA